MIQFPCKCGETIEVPQDLAGGTIQCPNCGLLADVPTLQDLPNLNKDGTFAFGDNTHDTQDVANIHLSFINKTRDNQGNVKDLRNSIDDYKTVGLQEHIAPRPAPRYDPITGELIRPLQLKDEKPVPVISIGEAVDPSALDEEDEEENTPQAVIPIPVIPVAPPRALGYAMGDTRKQVTLKTLAIELLMPANVAVMFFVFVLYILAYYASSGISTFVERFPNIIAVWPFLIVNIPLWLVVAQVGCVIETIGPDAVDELPRPLRDFSLDEDIFGPIFRAVLAGIICFAPLVLGINYLNRSNPAAMPLILLLAIWGAALAPGMLLTTITGTTVLNLRPDRVAAVIRLCGIDYLLSIVLFLLAVIPSTYYLAGILLFRQNTDGPMIHSIENPKAMFPLMALCVYLLHFFCWHMGMMYRQNHEAFPWLAQRHVKRNKPQMNTDEHR